MAVGMRLSGARELRSTLTRKKEIARTISAEEVKRIATEIMDGSKARAPEETGKLVDSHRMSVVAAGDHVEAVVSVGPVYSEDGHDYSIEMHEGLATGDGKYELGPGSEAKNLGTPHVGEGVGWKFLERSFKAVTRRVMKELRDRFARGLSGK